MVEPGLQAPDIPVPSPPQAQPAPQAPKDKGTRMHLYKGL